MIRSAPTDAVAFHSEIASDFNASYAADPNRLERLKVWRACLERHATPVALAYDIGCGSGMLTAEIAPRALKVIAVDGSEAMLALAKENMAGRGLHNVSFRQARLPIADTADFAPAPLVIASSVIEYLPALEEAVAMLKKLMAPGATLVFSISNKSSISRAIVRFAHRLTGRPRYFGLVLHFMDEEGIQALLSGAGLELVDLTYFGGEDWMNRMISRVFPHKLSTNMILAVARRPA